MGFSSEDVERMQHGPKRGGTERISAAEYRTRTQAGLYHGPAMTIPRGGLFESGPLDITPKHNQVPAQRINQITFFGRVPGNNGGDGLLRMHFAKKKKLLEEYKEAVYASRIQPFTGKVRLELTRYATGVEPDYDNLVSTGKLLVDAIVRCKIITDDKSSVIVERSYQWVRVGKKEAQKTVIKLTPVY